MNDRERLTFSRLQTRRLCPRQDYYLYEMRLRRDRTEPPLRMGAAYAEAKDVYRKARKVNSAEESLARACAAVDALYEHVPEWSTLYDWQIEHRTVRALVAGYFWRYSEDTIQVVQSEVTFDVPLVNPETNHPSLTFTLAGKIDVLARLENGDLAVHEEKLTGSDITEGSDYWLRLRYDGQLSQYFLAAQRLGHDVQTILFDVTRRPTLRPRDIPIRDIDGFKIVHDRKGNRVLLPSGKPRQAANREEGWEIQVRAETPDEWQERILKDIEQRPDWYFVRHEIPRLQQDLADFEAEIWQQAAALRECRRKGWWFRNASKLTCPYCPFKDLCLSGVVVDPASPPPGYVIIDDPNPELAKSGSDE